MNQPSTINNPSMWITETAEIEIHPLRLWRLTQKVSGKVMRQTHCAKAVGVGSPAWSDWEAGAKIPDPSSMVKIYVFTKGAVRPNHFYDLPKLDRKNP